MASWDSIVRSAVALIVTISFIAPSASGDEPDPRMQAIGLVDNEKIVVRLIVAREASLLDDEWLVLEFENPGNEEIRIQIDYRMEWSIQDPNTGKLVASNNLCSGQIGSTGKYELSPGTLRRLARPPSCQASCLCLAREYVVDRTARVEVKLHMTVVEFAHRTVLAQVDDKSFEFLARSPQAADIAGLQDKLRALLKEPVNSMDHVYRLGSLLDVPAVADGMTTKELWEAADRRSEPFEGQRLILKYFHKHRKNDPELINLAANVISAHDQERLDWLGSDVWDDAWVPLLVDWWLDIPSLRRPLELLHWHSAAWKDDIGVRTRLSSKVRDLYPETFATSGRRQSSHNAADPNQVVPGLKVAAMTHDPSLVAPLSPWLDDRRVLVTEAAFGRLSNFGPYSELRVCDVAAKTILITTGLGGSIGQDAEVQKLHPHARMRLESDLRPANPSTKVEVRQSSAPLYEQMLEYNDAVIRKLQIKLKETKSGNTP